MPIITLLLEKPLLLLITSPSFIKFPRALTFITNTPWLEKKVAVSCIPLLMFTRAVYFISLDYIVVVQCSFFTHSQMVWSLCLTLPLLDGCLYSRLAVNRHFLVDCCITCSFSFFPGKRGQILFFSGSFNSISVACLRENLQLLFQITVFAEQVTVPQCFAFGFLVLGTMRMLPFSLSDLLVL